MLGVSGIVLRACQLRPSPDTYDELVADFGPRVVSYWRFENSGADAKGTQHASITGSPELNVETIVDLDTIEEGAPADGQCIAWPGTPGVYAEAAHNARHKTAQGTIVVTFQRDSADQKSILVAADRPVGGTSNGPGGLSIEVEANGAPRCILRRQNDGVPVIMLGQAGDVALNRAYTLIFKWGAAGFSLALWDEDGTLVRRLTDRLSDGVTGTSPIRFGLWHDGASSPHDGPFGRVVWLDRRIADEEEPDLARPRSISRETPVGGYTPFPFVTTSNPLINHSGVAGRPGYSPTDPRSASIIDPMSGLEIFRVGGLNGETLFINGTQNSGLKFPKYLRTENGAHSVWNSDSTLMMVGRRFSSSGDLGDASSYLIDADGNHGASAPWRILRASSSHGLGIGNVWFWDYINPLRIIDVLSNGTVREFWPIGGNGNSVGKINTLFQVPGVSNAGSAHRTALKASYDGRFYMMPCRRNSDGALGGHRVDLIAGTWGPFIKTPLQSNNDTARCALGLSALGRYTYFNTNLGGSYNRYQVKDVIEDKVTAIVPGVNTISHVDFMVIDGEEYLSGYGEGKWRMMRCSGPVNQTDDDFIVKAESPFLRGSNPQHSSGRQYKDLMETVGAVGGSTSGLRYAIWARSGPNSGHERGIFGIRLGENDFNQVRYLCNHRSIRYSNRSEVHPRPSPDMKYVAFPSNWESPGVVSGDIVTAYVCIIPDAWRSPNNDGS